MSKLLHNLPVENLTEENDYLGIIEKGEIIKNFLESNTGEFSKIKMFSLYGEWGSGKSTLMKYLQKELEGTFNTYFFEAWQFEKDDNLSISLLEYLLEESNTVGEEVAKDILKYGGKILRGLGNSVQFNVPLYPTGPSISVNPSKFVDEFTKVKDVTFYKALEKFKEDFVRWEDLKNDRKDKEYSIIFIDDLDRCEPENVLNLLSALKLFFTYGRKTIFMCGIDKKAVNEAVKTKYQEVVKANEYLEKVFDISFSMPDYSDISKLVSQCFGSEVVEFESEKIEWTNFISKFFKEIGETNPRRVKKVLNKYSVLISLGEGYDNQIPNIYNKESESSVFETTLVLYIIILHEFCYEKYITLFDFKHKETLIDQIIEKIPEKGNHVGYRTVFKKLIDRDNVNKKNSLNTLTSYNNLYLILSFLPESISDLGGIGNDHRNLFNNYNLAHYKKMTFSSYTVDNRFLDFMIKHRYILNQSTNKSSTHSLKEFKILVRNIL